MTTEREIKQLRIERTSVTIPHDGKNTTFVYVPAHTLESGEEYLIELRRLEAAGLGIPKFNEVASLIKVAFNPQNQAYQKIREQTRKEGLWAFTITKKSSGKGIFFYDEKDRSRFSELGLDELEGMLGSTQEDGVIYSDDRTLRFTPFGFRTGILPLSDVSKNSFVVALTSGREGAERIAQAASYLSDRLYLSTYTPDDPLFRMNSVSVSHLNVLRPSGMLRINGNLPANWVGYAWGILKE